MPDQVRHDGLRLFNRRVNTIKNKLYEKQFSPYADRAYPTRVLWGDQHLHTEISVDAGTMCQEDAYRIARGEKA
jgi:hypothetical protein